MSEVYKSCSLVREAAQDNSGPQRKPATAVTGSNTGQLGDPAQPVADRIGVDEQQPGCGLERVSLLEIRHHGVQ